MTALPAGNLTVQLGDDVELVATCTKLSVHIAVLSGVDPQLSSVMAAPTSTCAGTRPAAFSELYEQRSRSPHPLKMSIVASQNNTPMNDLGANMGRLSRTFGSLNVIRWFPFLS